MPALDTARPCSRQEGGRVGGVGEESLCSTDPSGFN